MTNPFVQKPTHYISPEDVKTLKEALEHHEYQIISHSLEREAQWIKFTQKELDAGLKAKLFHTRIAEALRRVVG